MAVDLTGLPVPHISCYREAQSIPCAGELIDIFPSMGNRTNIVLVSVWGRNQQAEGHARYLRHVVRTLVDLHNPAGLLECANLAFHDRNAGHGNDCFASLFFASLYGTHLTYASAGHDFALLRRANGRHRRLPPTGKILGIKPSKRFGEVTIAVAPRDWLVLASDGITNARDRGGATFGDDGIVQSALSAIRNGLDDPAAHILAAAKAHCSSGAVEGASVSCVCFS
jgi:serine phosphatase RsbU (regulator of sigma subunit)